MHFFLCLYIIPTWIKLYNNNYQIYFSSQYYKITTLLAHTAPFLGVATEET